MLSDGPIAAGDVGLGPEILDHPDELPVAIFVEEFRPYVGDAVLGRHVMDANLAFLHDLPNVKEP